MGPDQNRKQAKSDSDEAYLYVEQGPGAGQALSIPPGEQFIGRASASELRLPHPSISRRHARITRKGQRIFVRDLSSQNGTYVNQVKIDREIELFPGDELVIGAARLRLRHGEASTEPVPRIVTAPGASPAIPTQPYPQRGSGWPILIVLLIFGFILAGAFLGWRKLKSLSAPIPLQAKVVIPQVAHPPPPPPNPEPPAAPEPPPHAPVPAGPRSPPVGSDLTILARYEAGKLDEAIALARKWNAKEILAKLLRFKAAYEQATHTLESRDEPAALKDLDGALKLDEQIASGWGKYNAELRRQLSSLYTLSGSRLRQSDPVAAQRAFSTALKYDPENAKARALLSELSPRSKKPASDETRQETGEAPERSRIDDAFGN